MKFISLAILFLALSTGIAHPAVPEAPRLECAVDNLEVAITWSGVDAALGYRLYYAPYPSADLIGSLDMNSLLGGVIALPDGSAFYVAVRAYNSDGYSDFSNIEYFILNESGDSPDGTPSPNYTNEHGEDRMLIVISAPSVGDEYYRDSFQGIIDFDIRYAKAIMGRDNVVVLADERTIPYLEKELPEDVILKAGVLDIWIRDFAPVHPFQMVQFKYDRPAVEQGIQTSFKNFAVENDLRFTQSNLKLDGGNAVDNGKDKIVFTEKVFQRNPALTEEQIITQLKESLGATDIAIIPMDEEFLGHADGMVMFTGDNTLLVNNYPDDPAFKAEVNAKLASGLPNVEIKEIEGGGYGEAYGDYASACGIYVNSVVTNRFIYAPVFDDAKDDAAIQTISSNTGKTVITINAKEVCGLGGSVRCLSWQLTGENARKLIEAARSR